jgi:hypothetical protein
MVDFRNEYSVHRSCEPPYPAVPPMDKALAIAVAYDKCLREEIGCRRMTIWEEPTLLSRYERLMRVMEQPFQNLLAVGPRVSDEYDGCPPPIRRRSS